MNYSFTLRAVNVLLASLVVIPIAFTALLLSAQIVA